MDLTLLVIRSAMPERLAPPGPYKNIPFPTAGGMNTSGLRKNLTSYTRRRKPKTSFIAYWLDATFPLPTHTYIQNMTQGTDQIFEDSQMIVWRDL